MFDEILELFGRRKRQHGADHSPSATKRGMPFEIPFLEGEDEQDEQDYSRREDDRRSSRRPSSSRTEREGDWF